MTLVVIEGVVEVTNPAQDPFSRTAKQQRRRNAKHKQDESKREEPAVIRLAVGQHHAERRHRTKQRRDHQQIGTHTTVFISNGQKRSTLAGRVANNNNDAKQRSCRQRDERNRGGAGNDDHTQCGHEQLGCEHEMKADGRCLVPHEPLALIVIERMVKVANPPQCTVDGTTILYGLNCHGHCSSLPKSASTVDDSSAAIRNARCTEGE